MAVEDNDKVKIRNYLSQNEHNLADVYAAHKTSLDAVEQEICEWKKFIKDYNVLQDKLTAYPNKTSYDAVIPIGSLALMKGRKIHTNEILIHLGDNWFVERSVKDALSVIRRRKEVCLDRLQVAKKTKQIHEGWMAQTQQIAKEKDQIDVLEHITEEQYQEDKEKRRELAAHHVDLMNEDEDDDGGPGGGTLSSVTRDVTGGGPGSIPAEMKTFEDLLRKLDALEEQERVNDEMDLRSDEEEEQEESDDDLEDEETSKDKLQRRVSWADQLTEAAKARQNAEGDSDSEEEKGKEPEESKEKVKVQMEVEAEAEKENKEEEKDDEKEDKPCVVAEKVIKYRQRQQSLPTELMRSGETPPSALHKSPADLYNMFAQNPSDSSQPTKGILKKKGESLHTEDVEKGSVLFGNPSVAYIPRSPDDLPDNHHPPPLSESPKEMKNRKPAFSYQVIARDPGELDSPQTTPESPETPLGEMGSIGGQKEEGKKISRFKASRMGNK